MPFNEIEIPAKAGWDLQKQVESIFLGHNLRDMDVFIWKLLEEGTKTHKSGFHLASIGTIDQGIAQLRTVVLRQADGREKRLSFHTDTRSAKISQIADNPLVSWLFYDARLRLQVRLQAKAHVLTIGEKADQAWNNSRLSSKLCYTSEASPGEILDKPFRTDISRKDVPEDILIQARKAFAVVETTVHNADWTFLHHQGNLRAYANYDTGEYFWLQA